MTTHRLFRILYCLLEKERVTAPELAQKMEVSVRTIYRDIDRLSGAGVPIYCNPGKGGGIFLMNSFVLDKSLLSEAEREDVLLSLQGLEALKGESQALEKLQSLFQANSENWIRVDFTDWRNQKYQADLFDIAKQAIFQKCLISFLYRGQEKEETRIVEPLQLVFKSQAWYLYGFCRSKQDFRFFKLSRVSQCQILSEKFERKAVQRSIIKEKVREELVRLKLKFDKSQAFRVYEEFSGQIRQDPDGNLLVETEFPKHSSLYSYLLSFLDCVEVIEPLEVRQELAQIVKTISQKYKT